MKDERWALFFLTTYQVHAICVYNCPSQAVLGHLGDQVTKMLALQSLMKPATFNHVRIDHHIAFLALFYLPTPLVVTIAPVLLLVPRQFLLVARRDEKK